MRKSTLEQLAFILEVNDKFKIKMQSFCDLPKEEQKAKLLNSLNIMGEEILTLRHYKEQIKNHPNVKAIKTFEDLSYPHLDKLAIACIATANYREYIGEDLFFEIRERCSSAKDIFEKYSYLGYKNIFI